MKHREILTEIDATLDQLIKNAAALKEVEKDLDLATALHKTQESLLAHLCHLDALIEEEPKKIVDKRALLSTLSKTRKRQASFEGI